MSEYCEFHSEKVEPTEINNYRLNHDKERINNETIPELRRRIKINTDIYRHDFEDYQFLKRRYLNFEGDHTLYYPSSELYQQSIQSYQEERKRYAIKLNSRRQYVTYCLNILSNKVQQQVNQERVNA